MLSNKKAQLTSLILCFVRLDELGPLFKAIFADFHARTCIRFVERTTEEHYLRVVFGSVLYTFVGLARIGGQIFSLPSGLLFVGTGSTIHYFMHAIGVYHELNRIDRDDYIEINYDNLDPGNCLKIFGNISHFKIKSTIIRLNRVGGDFPKDWARRRFDQHLWLREHNDERGIRLYQGAWRS